jgi:hypothetical protein
MVSPSPTTVGIAREHRDCSGETFTSVIGGTTAFGKAASHGWGGEATSDRRPHDASHHRAEGHGHGP